MSVCVLKSKCSVASHLKCAEYTESSSRAHRNSLEAIPKDCYPQVFRQDRCAGLPFSKVVLCPQKCLSSSMKGLHCDIRSVTSSLDQSCAVWDAPPPTSSSLIAQQSLASGRGLTLATLASASVSLTSLCSRPAKKPCYSATSPGPHALLDTAINALEMLICQSPAWDGVMASDTMIILHVVQI